MPWPEAQGRPVTATACLGHRRKHHHPLPVPYYLQKTYHESCLDCCMIMSHCRRLSRRQTPSGPAGGTACSAPCQSPNLPVKKKSLRLETEMLQTAQQFLDLRKGSRSRARAGSFMNEYITILLWIPTLTFSARKAWAQTSKDCCLSGWSPPNAIPAARRVGRAMAACTAAA